MARIAGSRGIRPQAYSPEEWTVRVDLAACYRLVAWLGWDDLIYTHISARIPGSEDQFLINPYGMLFDEITASSLLCVDLDGNKRTPSAFPVNEAGFTIHSAVHMARRDIQCVIHLHTLDGVAISALQQGLLPLTQTAVYICPEVAYHDYEGGAFEHAERPRLTRDLGSRSLMILRNHGTLAVGSSVADAFHNAYLLERACSMQVRAMSTGAPLHPIAPDVIEKAASQSGPTERRARIVEESLWPGLLRKLNRIGSMYAS